MRRSERKGEVGDMPVVVVVVVGVPVVVVLLASLASSSLGENTSDEEVMELRRCNWMRRSEHKGEVAGSILCTYPHCCEKSARYRQ